MPTPIVTLAAVLAVIAAGLSAEPADAAPMPFASGDDAANIPIDSSRTWVMQRWVAKRTGVIDRLYFYAKVEGSDSCPYGGRSGYADGTTGRLLATTHRVLPDGRPDMSSTLARSEFRPCGNDHQETVSVELGLPVRQGEEYATVVRNTDPSPGSNWFSANFLYVSSGVAGANGRNERNPDAADAFYGLDPRELVGYTTDGGATWRLPGGPYGGKRGAAFVPTYMQAYQDGPVVGQPYYWSSSTSSSVSMVYPRARERWTIRELGAYTSASSSGTVTLEVDGSRRASADLSGSGFLRSPIQPVEVQPGQTVEVSTSGGLKLREMQVDRFWAEKVGLGTGNYFFLDGDDIKAATVFPLPAYWITAGAPAPSPPAPGAAPPRRIEKSVVLSMRVGLRRTLVWLRSRVPGFAVVTLKVRGRQIARCAGLRLIRGKRVGCHVNMGRLHFAGLVVATATIRQGRKRFRLAKRTRVSQATTAKARRAATSASVGRWLPAVSLDLAVRRRGALAVVRTRRAGRVAVLVSVKGRTTARCRRSVGARRAGVRCRATVRRPAPRRAVVATAVLRGARGSATTLRVTGTRLP